MNTHQKLLFINLLIFICIYTKSIGATPTPTITWEIEKDSSNLSFLHRAEDLSALAPTRESVHDQYLRLFTPPQKNDGKSREKNNEYQNHIKALERIVTDHSKTDWNNDTNQYRSTYATSCDNYVTSAFCQKITLKISNPPYKYCSWMIDDKEAIYDSCDQHTVTIPIDKNIAVTVQPLNDLNKKIETSVRVDGKVILALGDSFASGEGNPDRPTMHYDDLPKEGSGYNFFLSHEEKPNDSFDGPLWLNRTCHRSLLSYQFKVALRYAAEHPKERVVFASFSCTGAEIISGLLQPQEMFPYTENGVPKWSEDEMSKFKISESKMSQLDQAMRFLCGDLIEEKKANGNKRIVCKDDSKFRKPDLILLSIGGNDAGFTPLILDTYSPIARIFFNITLPVPDVLKTVMRVFGAYQSPEQATTIVNTQLSELYENLNDELEGRGLIKNGQPNKIIQTNYPNLVKNCNQDWNKNGNYRFFNKTNPEFYSLGARGANFFVDLEIGTRSLKKLFENEIDMSISYDESKELTELIEKLQNVIDKNKSELGWEVVKLNNWEIRKHGICALDENKTAQETFRFPYREMDGDNTPIWKSDFKPSDWFFYLPERKRWFNTIDDSVMKLATRRCPEHWQIPKSLMSEETKLICAEMLMGAIHPDLAYHTRIADEVYKKAEDILAKTPNRLD
ncbi:hypothetical protein [Nitrosomonas sp.]|uniref:hypothetical protein n=1 Tax=Nitrosomonas sp. TaxID=42353 RepID=UPI0025CD5762|nr:hypothetical protein [Nitrosomonas sp.]MBV6447986.1 hypothetical protein [Nitrosomonas sp.]